MMHTRGVTRVLSEQTGLMYFAPRLSSSRRIPTHQNRCIDPHGSTHSAANLCGYIKNERLSQRKKTVLPGLKNPIHQNVPL
jgi:hypothetical protein